MPSISSNKPSKHVCPDCGRAYKAAETLNRHRKNHSETSQYACSICDASFKRKDLLDRHSQIHIGGKPATNRNRSHRACDRCSKLKTRCDNMTPCTRCSKGGHECTYKQVRSRARTDRSSASTSSSIHSSPHMTAEELNSMVGTPEELSPFDSNPTWIADENMVDSFWMQDSSWQWPEIDPSLQMMETEPSALRSTLPPIKDAVEPLLMLDPSLDTTSPQTSPYASISPRNMYNSHPSNITWHHQSPPTNSKPLAVGPTINNRKPSRTADKGPSVSRNTSTPTLPKLNGEAARIAQNQTIDELVLLSTATFNLKINHPKDRTRFWQDMSSKVELAFNLENLAENIFEHFHELFYKYFHVSWPGKEQNAETLPPHLYLMMAAIGAAYAGPQAEAFHLQTLDALRPKLIDAALHKTLSPEAILPLIQTLALLQAAMIYFGDRKALEIAPGLSSLIVTLCRRIDLFDWTKFDAQETRRKLAHGVARLDAAIAFLFNTETLLSIEERSIQGSMRDDDVLDKLLQRVTSTNKNGSVYWWDSD